MPWFYVQRPDGKWNIFSSVIDGYIAEGLSLDEIKKIRLDDFVIENNRDVDSLASKRPRLNVMDFDTAEERIKIAEE